MGTTSRIYRESLALLTDLYQLTMAYGYWKLDRAGQETVFNLFFRTHPFGGPLLYRMTGRHAEQWTEAEYQLTPSERGTSVQ